MAKKGCDCAKTIAVLSAMGAKHAARMHENSAAENIYDWSPADWMLHMKEEEDLLFPEIARRAGSWYWPNILIDQHKTFRYQIEKYGRLDENLMREHSKLEDELVKKYF